ncbi:MtrB/PioB family outer membrane beta-barrel protein [Roseateles sp. DAIF2]|uniref:MtrB/PioB family outer membrane beta-barrel protein n=1 Tax=Roseateles sp. DAIF2 TaxID=2714952 RepID=UPI0018A32BC7|nr:MtrB/PioB family outer membrane beta-barrel protein [Roseateles sp. DAIF2]QPF75084.1 MtrB/PioB family outer membrane beta-barrel protein [Roseateles sp. DAIF2]
MTHINIHGFPLALLALAAGAAQAQQSPYYIGGSLGVTHVSNIYRTGGVQPRNNDNVTTATLLAGLDQRLGRQRLFGDVSLRSNSYENNRSLRNNGYALNAGLDWETIGRLSGQLSVNSNRNLAQFNPGGGAPSVTKKNIEQTDQARASVRYGLASLLTLEGSLTHRRRDYSASEYDAYDYQQDTVSVGLTYRPSSALTLGVALRYGDGKYPHVPLGGGRSAVDDFTSKNVDLTGTWVPSAASTLSARLSASRRDRSLASSTDFSGATGSLTWNWQPTARLKINTTVMRDSGDETSFFNLGNIGGFTSDYSLVTNSLQINSSYELTGKVQLDAGLSHYDRSLSNSFQGNGDDKSTSLSLGLRWMVTRNGLIGCQINHDKRSGQSRFSSPYSANSYGCYGQITLR